MTPEQAQQDGFQHWDSNHPGYTIDTLNAMLKPLGVEIKILMINGDVWYKAEEIAKEKRQAKGKK